MSRVLRFFDAAAAIAASNRFWIAVIVLLTLAVYGPGLTGWFVTDDFIFLRAAHLTSPLGYVKEAFDFSGYDRHDQLVEFARNGDINLPCLCYRPLYFVSLEAIYLVSGENPVGYHAASLIVHLANTLLVWLIASRLLESRLGPRMAALIFALHPAYVASVAWIADITTPLATLTVLLSLLFFMRSMESDPPHRGWYAGSLVCYAASTFFHQETIPWVAAFVAFYLLMNAARRSRAFDPKSWAILLPFIGVAAGLYALQEWIVAHTPVNQGAFHVGSHMLTHFKNLAGAALFPVTSEDFAAARFVAFVAVLLMLVTLPAIANLRRRNVALPRAELFVIVWFLASLAPLLTADLDYLSRVGVLDRKLYSAGPALAIFLVMYGTALLNLPPTRLQPYVKVLSAALLPLALVGGMMLARDNGQPVRERAQESEQFVQALRETYPSLPERSTLYVVGAPRTLRGFGDVHLLSCIQAFYGRVDAYNVTGERAAALERSLDEGDHVFRYVPSPD